MSCSGPAFPTFFKSILSLKSRFWPQIPHLILKSPSPLINLRIPHVIILGNTQIFMGEQIYLKLLFKLNMADRRRRCQLRRGRLGRMTFKRVIRDRLKPLEVYTDDELFERYRFRRATIVLMSTGRHLGRQFPTWSPVSLCTTWGFRRQEILLTKQNSWCIQPYGPSSW